ncbi:MAG: hydroxymethylbilane synthase [Chlamydiales bacterium]|nr:hydroxymethylbilane synthase [Chlamydiales bacterium]
MSKKRSERLSIKVGARDSNLSRRQVEEVQAEYAHLLFEPVYVKTVGDRDRTTSLRILDKTDFFTREIDEMLLRGECRIAIHSAKDLPEPLPKGLELIKLTKGVDPSDSLVMRKGERLSKAFVIATSSVRREEMVRTLTEDLFFVDIRGTIEERLAKLESGEVDGVVIAEAALIRLGLTDLNRIRLPGETAPLQGQLAILARKGDREMHSLFNL